MKSEWRWRSLRGGGVEIGIWFGKPILSIHRDDDEFGGSIALNLAWLTFKFSYNCGEAATHAE